MKFICLFSNPMSRFDVLIRYSERITTGMIDDANVIVQLLNIINLSIKRF